MPRADLDPEPPEYGPRKRNGRIYVRVDPYPVLLARCPSLDADVCWIAHGPTKNGYPLCNDYRGWMYGHRLSYERSVGPITPKSRVHHTCETPLCVNYRHLVPLSASEHAAEHGLGLEACKNCGHSDWYIRPDTGGRMCRECRRARRRSAAARVCVVCETLYVGSGRTCSTSCGLALYNRENRAPEPPHGTIARYKNPRYKCRCSPCKKANADYVRTYTARKKSASR